MDTRKKYIHSFMMIALTIIIGLCPPIYSITPYGMKVLGVFIGIIYGWIFLDLMWPSLFGFVALGCIGQSTILSMFTAGLGNSSLMLVFLPMLFAGALEEGGVTTFMAERFLKVKIFRKSPLLLLISLIALSFVLGILQAGLAATLVVWALVLKVADECALPKENHLVSFLLFMVIVASFSGALVLPFGPGPLMWSAFYPEAATVPYITFIAYTSVLLIVIFIILSAVSNFYKIAYKKK